MKKTIWIISQYSGTPDYGMNYRSFYISKELVKCGYSVTIFSGAYSHLFKNYPETKGLFTTEQVDGIRYIWVKLRKYRGSKSLGRLMSMFEFMVKLFLFNTNKLQKPDILIISSISILSTLNAYVWSKILKINFIFEVRDLWPLTLIELGNISQYHPLVLFLGAFEKLGYRKAIRVVSVLPEAFLHMETKGMPLSKFKYIPNGINLDELSHPEPLDQSIIDQFPKKKFIIGYAGTVGISNAMEYFVDAAALLQNEEDIYFIIVGNDRERSFIRNRIEDLELCNVTMIKAVDKRQVQTVLKLFDVCYIGWHKTKLYRYGISANKIFEYMYSATPIIHSYSGNGDLVKIANCGISIESENSHKIIEAVKTLHHMEQNELSEMGERGRQYVLQNHLYSQLGKQYNDIILNSLKM